MKHLKQPDRQICKNIKRYLQKEGRVSFELRELSELLRFSPLCLFTSHLLEHKHPQSSLLKLFLLFHRLVIQNPGECESISQLLTQMESSAHGSLEQMLEQKLTKPYRLYLQRRVMMQLENRFQDGFGGPSAEGEARVYQLLNIINLATSFCDVIYTFGRYYLNKYGWAIDFNIVLGADLNGLYEEMVRCVKRPANRAILDEIESAHQRMYVVFYNCYFHKYLKGYIPKWVNTDVYSIQMRRRVQTPQKQSTKSTVSREATAKQRSLSSFKGKEKGKERIYADLGDSCLFLNEKVEEQVEQDPEHFQQVANPKIERPRAKNVQQPQQDPCNQERIKLLMSMERVLGR